MKKFAFGLALLVGFASLGACKSQQQTYRPAPVYTGPSGTGGTTYTQPQPAPYTQPTPTPPAPRAACGGGKCG